tara:strand:- start:269 stop:397 length:129 start_codon:yes stop_codon:yes gene_type:complete
MMEEILQIQEQLELVVEELVLQVVIVEVVEMLVLVELEFLII